MSRHSFFFQHRAKRVNVEHNMPSLFLLKRNLSIGYNLDTLKRRYYGHSTHFPGFFFSFFLKLFDVDIFRHFFFFSLFERTDVCPFFTSLSWLLVYLLDKCRAKVPTADAFLLLSIYQQFLDVFLFGCVYTHGYI